MIISEVRLFEVSGTISTGTESAVGSRSGRPLDVYPEFSIEEPGMPSPGTQNAIRQTFLEIRTDEGVSGCYGPIDGDQAHIIRTHLKNFLLGRDPLATALLHDQMLRINRHGRIGIFVMGISAVDCALWDLKGKAWGHPVFRLLGGPTRTEVEVYASMLGYNVEPENAVAAALKKKQEGYAAQKWFFRYGPADGEKGLERNIALAASLREALGASYPIMFDAFSGWCLDYAIRMAHAIEPYSPAWLEEPLPSERVGALRELRSATRIPIATGEHVHTRWRTKELLTAGAVSILQNDPDWTGGITELSKICAIASSFEVPVNAHGHSLWAALHVACAESPATVPWVEFLIKHQSWMQHFLRDPVAPENGRLRLPVKPGLGIDLDESKIEKVREI